VDVLIVSHTHWDREWYRTFEAFRARLVDTVDRVLDQLEEDAEWRFLLDGQAIVLEDYLEVRPARRARLVAAVSSGRLAVGPWYVQPDSLLPSGESHVRNLLEGRAVAGSFGRVSGVAYAPDSFGHPAQFPQLFAGFGLGPFVYWRGNGDEIDRLGPVYRWESPDGSSVLAYALLRGYFSAAGLPPDPDEAAEALVGVAAAFGEVERAPVVLMNGVDHAYPQPHTASVAAALAARTGHEVRRGVLDDLVATVDPADRPSFEGELLGGRLANLLPGVWSSRLGLKLANRRAERALFGWAEPWAALGAALGLPDESPSLRTARRALLANHAHDSIGGCSQDEVHRQMAGRFATAVELAEQTAGRLLERLAGLEGARRMAWDTEFDVAVFNPSPFPRTDVVRIPLDGYPLFSITYDSVDVHPLSLAGASVAGYEADGRPVRVAPSGDVGRVRMVEDVPPLDLELLVEDVPAFGWRRVHLAPSSTPTDDEVDGGTTISNGAVEVGVAPDGTLTLSCGDRSFSGLAGIEDQGDRGDTYDFDPVDQLGDPGASLRSVIVERRRHPSGIQRLVVTRRFDVPACVAPERDRRVDDTVVLTVRLEARVAPKIDRVDLHVETDNPARDHRLRLLFPTGAPVGSFLAATTFDVATRTEVPPPATGWWHVPPDTFPHQGWVSANGLSVAAPGLPEAMVTPEGVIAITLLRAVGWLSHLELGRRPIPAGPTLVVPDAQCSDGISADLSLRVIAGRVPDPGHAAATAAADELGLRAVPAGSAPLFAEGRSLVRVDPASVVLSALKPAEDGDGVILRVLNPTDDEIEVSVTVDLPFGEAVSVRLDETPDGRLCERRGSRLVLPTGAHALRSVRLRPNA
jgi:hypothetical protein